MKYYKYLSDLDWRPVAEKLKWYVLEYDKKPLIYDDPRNMAQTVNQLDLHKQVPELSNLFSPLNLTIRNVSFFVSTTLQNAIHHDGVPENCRINIPVLNCNNSETKFYVSSQPVPMRHQPNGQPFFSVNREDCTYVDSYFLKCPVILRVNELHQVFQDYTNIPRVACTIAFNENIEHWLDD